MTIIIKKDLSTEQIEEALEPLKAKRHKWDDFFGKLPNTFGDGLAYQKQVRNNDWKD